MKQAHYKTLVTHIKSHAVVERRTFVIKTCFSMGCAKLSSTVQPSGLWCSRVNSRMVASGNSFSASMSAGAASTGSLLDWILVVVECRWAKDGREEKPITNVAGKPMTAKTSAANNDHARCCCCIILLMVSITTTTTTHYCQARKSCCQCILSSFLLFSAMSTSSMARRTMTFHIPSNDNLRTPFTIILYMNIIRLGTSQKIGVDKESRRTNLFSRSWWILLLTHTQSFVAAEMTAWLASYTRTTLPTLERSIGTVSTESGGMAKFHCCVIWSCGFIRDIVGGRMSAQKNCVC